MNSRMAACGAFARMPMLSQVGRIATLLLAATSIPCWAIGPSFDCDKVTTPLAHFICARSDLSRTDLEFVQSYYALRQQVGPAGWPALKREDLDFQNRVAQQCGITTTGALPSDSAALAACLQQKYEQQHVDWLARLAGAAREEASRPLDEHLTLQGDLQSLGFLPPSEKVDGVYGAASRSAIVSWQRSRGLLPTALLSNDDARRLEQDARRAKAPPETGLPTARGTDSPAESHPRVSAAQSPDLSGTWYSVDWPSVNSNDNSNGPITCVPTQNMAHQVAINNGLNPVHIFTDKEGRATKIEFGDGPLAAEYTRSPAACSADYTAKLAEFKGQSSTVTVEPEPGK
jgi:hypothetical protein